MVDGWTDGEGQEEDACSGIIAPRWIVLGAGTNLHNKTPESFQVRARARICAYFASSVTSDFQSSRLDTGYKAGYDPGMGSDLKRLILCMVVSKPSRERARA